MTVSICIISDFGGHLRKIEFSNRRGLAEVDSCCSEEALEGSNWKSKFVPEHCSIHSFSFFR